MKNICTMRCYIKLCLCQFVVIFNTWQNLRFLMFFLLPYTWLKIGFSHTVMIHKYNTSVHRMYAVTLFTSRGYTYSKPCVISSFHFTRARNSGLPMAKSRPYLSNGGQKQMWTAKVKNGKWNSIDIFHFICLPHLIYILDHLVD